MSDSPEQRQIDRRSGTTGRDDDDAGWSLRPAAPQAQVVYKRRRAVSADAAAAAGHAAAPGSPDERAPRVFRLAPADEAAARAAHDAAPPASLSTGVRRRRTRRDSVRAPGAVHVIVAPPPPAPPRPTAQRLHEQLAAVQRTLDDIARAQDLLAALQALLPHR